MAQIINIENTNAVENGNNATSVQPQPTRAARPTEAKPVSWNLFGEQCEKGTTIHDVFADTESANNIAYNVSAKPLLRVTQDVIDAIKAGQPFDWQPTAQDIITSHKATMRDDNLFGLGVVGKDYNVVQNQAAFDFIDMIGEVSGNEPNITAYGALGHGERMFITATIGEDSFIDKDDAIRNYVVFTNAHDGSGSVMAFFTPIRVICQNTLNMAIRECPNKVVFKHTKNVDKRLDWQIAANREKAFEVFSKGVKFSEAFKERMLFLKSQDVTTEDVQLFTAQMCLNKAQIKLWEQAGRNVDKVDEIATKTKNGMLALSDAIENGIGQQQHRGTKLWLLNGLTTLLHNESKYKDGEAEFKSLMEGGGLKKVEKAYQLLAA